MSAYQPAIEYFFTRENGLSEDKNDPGGITNHGVSLRFLRSLQTKPPVYENVPNLIKYGVLGDPAEEVDVRNLTQADATELLYDVFWVNENFLHIEDQSVCNYIFDAALNMGISPAVKCAQRAYWALMGNRSLLVDDGILGEYTIYAINAAGKELLTALRSESAGECR